MLFRIGTQWYQMDGFKLVPVDAPDKVPAEGEFVDGDKLAGELDGLELAALKDKAKALTTAYEEARTKASTGTKDDYAAAKTAGHLAAVAQHLYTQRVAEVGELPEAHGLEPNPTEDDKGKDKADKTAETVQEPEEDEDTGGDTGGEEISVPDDLSGLQLTGQELQTVAAAGQILTRARETNPDALAALMPHGGTTQDIVQVQPAEQAVFTAAAGLGNEIGAVLSLEEMAEAFARFASGVANGRSPNSAPIGRWHLFGPKPNMVVSASATSDKMIKVEAGRAVDFQQRRAEFRQWISTERTSIQAAAPARCGPRDVRRTINYAGDHTAPLLNLVQNYSSPYCELEYYRDITLADVADGITVWDEATRQAYQDARDAWLGDPTAANLAALKAAEKTCATAGCAPTDVATQLPIAACLEYPTDLQNCSPETILAYNRALERAWIRERSANFLAVVATKSARVTVDASAAPFINQVQTFDGTDLATLVSTQLGAAAVVDYVVTTLKGIGVMAERITEGNYVVVLPYGLQAMLELDRRLAHEDAIAMISEGLGGARVVTTLDVATGGSLPWPSLPANGSTTAFTALRAPTDWDIYVMDPDDWFAIPRTTIELGAQITENTIRGNMAFGGFMESHEGYGKDGAHPTWVIGATNLVYNGARPARINPEGLLT